MDHEACLDACLQAFHGLSIFSLLSLLLLPPVWHPLAVDVTCLLTLLVALWQRQYQVMARPLGGSRRSYKTPHCHHHYQFDHHHLYCPPCQRRKKRKTLTEFIVRECNRVSSGSLLQIFHPHDVGQWSRELVGLDL
jgi:hypothetical protein